MSRCVVYDAIRAYLASSIGSGDEWLEETNLAPSSTTTNAPLCPAEAVLRQKQLYCGHVRLSRQVSSAATPGRASLLVATLSSCGHSCTTSSPLCCRMRSEIADKGRLRTSTVAPRLELSPSARCALSSLRFNPLLHSLHALHARSQSNSRCSFLGRRLPRSHSTHRLVRPPLRRRISPPPSLPILARLFRESCASPSPSPSLLPSPRSRAWKPVTRRRCRRRGRFALGRRSPVLSSALRTPLFRLSDAAEADLRLCSTYSQAVAHHNGQNKTDVTGIMAGSGGCASPFIRISLVAQR